MIHYTVKGSGEPLVLIHGFPNDSTAWDNVVPGLSQHYRLILPDLPGAGQSPLLEAAPSMALLADAVKEVLDHENIGKALFIGHSMGGYTAMQIASMYPEMVQGISLVHSMASADNAEKKENRRKAIVLMKKGQSEKEMFLKGMSQNLFAPEFAAQHPDVVKEVVAKGMMLSSEALVSFYQAIMDRTDKKDVLERATWPMQWIIGDHDNATPMKEALEQCHLSAVSSVSIYKPCGHMSFLEMPNRLLADLLAFAAFCYPE